MSVKYFAAKDIDKGIIKQYPASTVLWADGRNVRFTPGYVSKTLGKTLLATAPGGLPVRATFTFVGTDTAVRTLVCCDTAVYAYNADFSSYSDITPAVTPTGGAGDIWQFELVAGLPILSNGKNAIWKWAAYNTVLTPLSGAPTYAKRISSCMHRLIASDISEGGYTYTGRVRWTEPGNPENWTIDTTGKAGRFDIVNFNSSMSALEKIKAQIAYGSKVFFFTEKGLWVSDFAQATKQFIPIDTEAEILSARAACQYGGKIYYIGKKDAYSTTGSGPSKALALPIRDEIFDGLNSSYLSTAFAFAMPSTGEIWFCVATGSNTVPDTAYIFNVELECWSIADVDFFCHGTANSDGIPYEIAGTSAGYILRMDYGNNNYSAGTYSAIDGRIESGDLAMDFPDYMKTVAEVVPDLAEQSTVSELMVQVGVKNRLQDDLAWSDPVAFTIGASELCDFDGFRREGKFVRVRFYSNEKDAPWALAGYFIKYEIGGTR